MIKAKLKTAICIAASLALVAGASVGLTACKQQEDSSTAASKRISSTKPLSPEASSELESMLAQDDNVVEDPFDENGNVTTKAGSETGTTAKSGSSTNTKNGGSNSGTTKSAAKSTTKKSSKTTTKKSSTTTTKKSSKTTTKKASSKTVTDENGDVWTGWY